MFRAPATAPASYTRLALLIPDSEEWQALFFGLLVHLTDEYNWSDDGIGRDQAAQTWRNMMDQWFERERAMYISQVFFAGGVINDPAVLPADGRQIDQVAYPDLYAAIGATFGAADPGYFRLPKISQRIIVASGSGGSLSDRVVGDMGGNESIGIAISNLPPHDHPVLSNPNGVALTPGELPVALPESTPSTTGSTGGGDPIDIMPPFIVLNAYIVVR